MIKALIIMGGIGADDKTSVCLVFSAPPPLICYALGAEKIIGGRTDKKISVFGRNSAPDKNISKFCPIQI